MNDNKHLRLVDFEIGSLHSMQELKPPTGEIFRFADDLHPYIHDIEDVYVSRTVSWDMTYNWKDINVKLIFDSYSKYVAPEEWLACLGYD